MIRTSSTIALGVALVAAAACNPFHHTPAVQMDNTDLNANSRWHAMLTSPASLTGVVRINGTATMTPGDGGPGGQNTRVTMELSNAAPGGVHPWQMRAGQCGSDEGAVGSADAYHALTIDDHGRASTTARLAMPMPTDGRYYVTVYASPANAETVVACGNMAAPSR